MSTATDHPERFTEEQLAGDVVASRSVGGTKGQPTFADLKAHLDKWGPDGVLESAVHLPADQYEKLEKLVKKLKPRVVVKRGSRKRVKVYD